MPAIQSSVQSDTKHVKLFKINHHLESVPSIPLVPVEVAPEHNYKISVGYKVERAANQTEWISFGGLSTMDTSEYVYKGSISFNPSGIAERGLIQHAVHDCSTLHSCKCPQMYFHTPRSG